MQTPNKLTDNEIDCLRKYIFDIKDQSEVTTTSGQKFSYSDHCLLAYMMWQRMGKNNAVFHRKWQSFMGNNCSLHEAMNLVAYHVVTFLDSQEVR